MSGYQHTKVLLQNDMQEIGQMKFCGEFLREQISENQSNRVLDEKFTEVTRCMSNGRTMIIPSIAGLIKRL